MNTVIISCSLIVLARIADVSLDTIRTASIIQGRRMFGAVIGLFQALIFIFAVAKVLSNTGHPSYQLAYGVGFGLGTYLGITLEQRLAFGQQVASLFTRKGVEVARGLVLLGYRVVKVDGHAHDGDVSIVYVEVARKAAQKLIRDAGTMDEKCFYVLNDVREARYTQAAPC